MSLRKDVYQTKKLLNLDKLNVLIIDDFNFMARLMEAMLLEIGIGKTFMARNLEDAKAVLNTPQNAIDLIIMDWPMPQQMGQKMLKWVRRHPAIQIKFLPIMVCGSKLTSADLNAARNAGATEFLVKPLSAQKLASRVKYMIEQPRGLFKRKHFLGRPTSRREYSRSRS